MKACPYCAEEIQDEAIVCRFCHNQVVTAEGEDVEGINLAEQMAIVERAGDEDARAMLRRLGHKGGLVAFALVFPYMLYQLPQGYNYESFLELSLWAAFGAFLMYVMVWLFFRVTIWLFH